MRGPSAGGGHALALLVLILVPLGLRLSAVGHGDGRNYVPDTHVVRSALGMAKEKNPVPPVGRYSTYPYLMPYMLLPVYAAQYGMGRVSGDWSGSGEFAQAVALEPFRVHLPARLLVVLFGAMTPWVVFRGLRAAGLRAGAWCGAWLVGVGLLHLQFSVQERPWVPLVFFMALSCWPAALFVSTGRMWFLVWSGLAAALSFASHQAGLAALGIPGLAWLFARGGWGGAALWARVRAGVLCVLVFAGAALAVGHPYLLVHGSTPTEEVAGSDVVLDDAPEISVGGQKFLIEFRAASLTRLSRALFGYDPALVVLALLGLFGALRLRTMLPATVFALLWAALFMTNQNDHVRYLLPLSVLLAWPAAVGAQLLCERTWTKVLLAALLALPFVQAGRLVWLLREPDTRATAEALVAELPADARLAIGRFGPEVELSAPALERLETWRGLGTREQTRLDLLSAGEEVFTARGLSAGVDAIPLGEVFQFNDRAAGTPDEVQLAAERAEDFGLDRDAELGAVFNELGITHVLDVDRGLGRPDPLGDWIAAQGDGAVPIFAVEPGDGEARAEYMLPLELDFALTGVWNVRRPGPALRMFELP